MTTKHTPKKSACFTPAFPLFFLMLFFFAACPQPHDETAGTGPEPPAAPAMPELLPGNRRLILSWPAVPGADSYEVFCGKTEPGPEDAPVQTVTVPAADISGLENGTSYYVRLRAKNSFGLSAFSPLAAGIPALQTPPPSLVRGSGELSAGWAAEEGVDYEVWYGTDSNTGAAVKWNGPVTRSGIIAGTSITGLSNGTAYSVWIKTAGGFGAGTSETPEAAAPADEDFVYVPGGTVSGSGAYAFTVTVPADPPGYTEAGKTSTRKGVFVEGRRVRIGSFVMAQYETTQGLWFTVQNWALEHGYQFQNKKNAPSEANKNKPVTGLSWRDALVWCNAYSEMSNKQAVYTYGGAVIRDSRNDNAAACDGAVMDKTKTGFRLPTEAEREFAARGGDPGKADWMFMYAGSNRADEVAWHHGNSAYQIETVGIKKANRLGVFDLSGNVQEWCWDWMNWAVDVTAASPEDGAAYSGTAPFANQKAFNGGGVGSNITMSCVSYRWGYVPGYTDPYVGFRVVRNP